MWCEIERDVVAQCAAGRFRDFTMGTILNKLGIADLSVVRIANFAISTM